jgi:hypothetical protein
MRYLKRLLAGAAVLAALQTAARAEETVYLKAPYAYGLLASATCGKGDAEKLKALVTRFAKIAGATKAPEKADGEAFCSAFTKTFPVGAKWGDIILARADEAGAGAPQPQSDPSSGKGGGVRVEELEISFLGLKVKVKFGPKKPADSEGHTGGGGREEGGGTEGGTEGGGEETPAGDGGEPTTPAN